MDKILQKLRQAVSRRQDKSGSDRVSFAGNLLPVRRDDVRSSIMNWGSYRWVVAITVLVAIYYVFIASDRYVTKTQLYVKSSQGSAIALPSTSLLSPLSGQSQDSMVLKSYITSSDMAQALQGEIGLKEHFSSTEWDVISRLSEGADFEKFLKYYRDRISVNVEANSSVLTLKVSAFTPEYSQQLASQVLEEAANYLNEINKTIARQEIEFMEGQLADHRGRLDEAKNRLLAFQAKHGTFSPKEDGRSMQSIVTELEAELVRLQTERKVLESYLNDNAPQVISIDARIASVSSQLEEERGKIGQSDAAAINELYFQFEELERELKFATDLYASTRSSLEQARVESFHNMKHLVIVQAPRLPDQALEPRKLYNIATLFVLLSLAYGIVTMVMATIREHRDV